MAPLVKFQTHAICQPDRVRRVYVLDRMSPIRVMRLLYLYWFDRSRLAGGVNHPVFVYVEASR